MAGALSDNDIVDAYHYMLGRWLVLRQETLDFQETFKWNDILHREPGGVRWANPNLDVACSEAWIYVDDSSCTIVELPEIKRRYYTLQVMNGWAEVITNVNERNFPQHPYGRFAFCLKGTKADLPRGTERIDLPDKKSRVLMRIELGANPTEAAALQKQVTMRATGSPNVEAVVASFDFPNERLPGAEAFLMTEAILASDADINQGMEEPQRKAHEVAKAAADLKARARIDDVIRRQAIPALHAYRDKFGTMKDGWIHPRPAGNYGSDFLMRAFTNFTGIWANTADELTCYSALSLDGSKTYVQTYPKSALPESKARYFWSVIVGESETVQVNSNPLKRCLLNNQSGLEFNGDGSLTLAFAPRQPTRVPKPNWLPTAEGKKYNLTYRFYGPAADVVTGRYFPPPMVQR